MLLQKNPEWCQEFQYKCKGPDYTVIRLLCQTAALHLQEHGRKIKNMGGKLSCQEVEEGSDCTLCCFVVRIDFPVCIIFGLHNALISI